MSTKALTPDATATADSSRSSLALSQLTSDLRLALSFTERTANAVTFTVPDRTGDDAVETIRYSWSGTAGDPLLYQINGSTAVTIIANVQQFNLTSLVRTIAATSCVLPSTVVAYLPPSEGKAASAATSVNIAAPIGLVPGHLMIAAVAVDGSHAGAVTAPTGWTLVNSLADSSGNITTAVWWKIATAGEASNYTFSWTTPKKAYGWITRFSGVKSSAPINAFASTAGTSATSSPAAPTVTTTVAEHDDRADRRIRRWRRDNRLSRRWESHRHYRRRERRRRRRRIRRRGVSYASGRRRQRHGDVCPDSGRGICHLHARTNARRRPVINFRQIAKSKPPCSNLLTVKNALMDHRRHQRRRGGGMVEILLASAIVGYMIVASLDAAAMVARTQRFNAGRLTGPGLARELMAEIMSLPYDDPQNPGAAIGVNAGESASNRSTFDDVDDYNGWSSANAVARNGTARSGYTGWSHTVTVTWAERITATAWTSYDTGLKRITVTVTSPTGVATQLMALRSWSGPLEQTLPIAADTVGWTGIELRTGSGARSEFAAGAVVNHAYDVD